MSPLAFWRRLLCAPLLAVVMAGCATAPAPAPLPDPPVAEAPVPAAPAASEATAVAPPPAEALAQAAEAQARAATVEPAASAASAVVPATGEPQPVDPLRPEELVDLDDVTAHSDLWARLRGGFSMIDLDTPLVRSAEQWYASRPDYVARMTERGSRYLFHIVEEVERRGLPSELALLPFIESAFNPQAMSSAKASGMWQFMPGTGRAFALKQNVFRDDRRDVLASTRAALDYLERLHGMFGDWHLALAAYNWGEGNVQRAIKRNLRARKPTDYLSLRMPAETKYYVPKLQAVKNLVMAPERYGLALPELANHPHFLSVPITRDIDVELAARLAGMEVDDFRELNPQMNKPVILAAGTPYILLPYDNANLFVRAVADHRGAMASWTAWVAPKTLRPSEAARHVGMSEEELRDVNRIPPRMLVKAGSTLLVPRAGDEVADVEEHIADNGTMALAPEAPGRRRVSFKAGRKDTVASVARRYRVPAQQVARWNDVPRTARFKPGQKVVVYVAVKKPRASKAVLRAKAKARPISRKSAPTTVRRAKVSK